MKTKLSTKMLVTPRSTKIMATFALVGFLALFVLMTVVFYQQGVMPLAIADCISVGVYIVLIVLLYREYWRTFAALIFTQVYVHNVLAVYYIGWDAQFQLTFIVLIVLGFYAEYAARAMKVKTFRALFFAVIGFVLYFALLFFSVGRTPPYILSPEVTLGFQALWSFVLFLIVIAYLELFIRIARNSEEVMSDKATHDTLTGLPNRSFMTDYVENLVMTEGLEGHWVAMADIDDFKHINDTRGHNCGDYVLKSLAELMRVDGSNTMLCRWGGEEFLLVGKTHGDMMATYDLLDRLRKSIEEHGFWYEDQRLRITITIGVAPFETGQTFGEWVNAADKKLYEGKCTGKNKVIM